LQRQLAALTDEPAVLERIDVLNVDRLANQIVAETRGAPTVAESSTLNGLWRTAATAAGRDFSAVFLQREWEQVILAHDIRDLSRYLEVRRHGRGKALQRAQKIRAWNAIQQVVDGLHRANQQTYPQIAEEAAALLAARTAKPYRHVVVDEAQDLNPAQWRLLRAAVAPGPDDLFIVADPHQRIYDNRVSLASLGINVRGRSRRLTINYRTTQEILTWAVRLLAGMVPEGLDDEVDSLRGYRSPVHGLPPAIHAAANRVAEIADLVGQVRMWLANGVEPHSIGVAARNRNLARNIRDALTTARLPATTAGASKTNAVRVDTMHAMKGLEFRCVAVAGVEAGMLPPKPPTVTPESEDPVAHAQDIQRERCLLFVACTRALDSLYLSYAGEPSPLLPSD
jgi:superfamily I DNA/RNA helicase